jgi:hypothetical protein
MKRVWELALVGAVLVSACGDEPSQGAGAAAEVSQEDAAFGSTLWQIRGHHLVSLELYAGAEADLALLHAGHPLDEVLPSVEGEIGERDGDAASTLRETLERAVTAVRDGAPAEEVEAAYDEALDALTGAEAAVIGEAASSDAYVGSVVAGLLATAGHEYEEAAPQGEVTNLEEYQDAYGFLLAAKDLYAGIGPGIEESAAHEAEEIDEAFGRLEEALPGPQPPDRPAGAEDVEKLAAVIGHELEETVGAVVATEVDAEEVWENLDALLDQVLAEYQEGEAEEASELAAEAYLENYELVEGEVIEHAPDINAELEPLLAAELRAAIADGVPADELEQLIERAKDLLAEARQTVEEAES